MKKITFIGHRQIFCKDIKNQLSTAIQKAIKCGYKKFIMGTHGEFDKLALSTCRDIRKIYRDIEIEVVITSLNQIKKSVIEEDNIIFDYTPYQDVNTVMYDIENEYFKKQITISNQKMIDDCEILICYVNPSRLRSGAKTAMNHAKKKGLKIINLFQVDDDIFYNKTKKEKQEMWENYINKKC